MPKRKANPPSNTPDVDRYQLTQSYLTASGEKLPCGAEVAVRARAHGTPDTFALHTLDDKAAYLGSVTAHTLSIIAEKVI